MNYNSFTAYRGHGDNFTPASLIYEWAQANQLESWQTMDGIRVRAGGDVWKYGHLAISEDGNRDKITVYMEREPVYN